MTVWIADGPAQADGVVGGDGAGTAYSVRYVRADKPGALITSYWYAVSLQDRYGDDSRGTGFDVEHMTEYLICTDPADPGGTEIWSDNRFENPLDIAYDCEQEADAFARNAALSDVADGYDWDGEIPSSGTMERG